MISLHRNSSLLFITPSFVPNKLGPAKRTVIIILQPRQDTFVVKNMVTIILSRPTYRLISLIPIQTYAAFLGRRPLDHPPYASFGRSPRSRDYIALSRVHRPIIRRCQDCRESADAIGIFQLSKEQVRLDDI